MRRMVIHRTLVLCCPLRPTWRCVLYSYTCCIPNVLLGKIHKKCDCAGICAVY
jgi:hypothetical protein